MSTESPDVREAVGEDRDLQPGEKETTIRFEKDRDRATVFTAEAGLMRRLLAHPEFTVRSLTPEDGRTVEHVEEVDVAEDRITGVVGTIPVGALKVRASSRAEGGHADVVTYAGGGSA